MKFIAIVGITALLSTAGLAQASSLELLKKNIETDPTLSLATKADLLTKLQTGQLKIGASCCFKHKMGHTMGDRGQYWCQVDSTTPC